MMKYHISVMLKESVNLLNCSSGKVIVDGTLGGFGHADLICDKIGAKGIFIGIDQDLDSIENAKMIAVNKTPKVHLIHDNFANLSKILKDLSISKVDGIIIDIGLSLHQISRSGRGFSFLKDEPLDMRMNINSKETAASLLARLSEYEIKKILYGYGEERWAGRIAKHLVKIRKIYPIKTTMQLSSLIKESIPKKYIKIRKNHPATKVFMALRIAVNKELDCLKDFLLLAVNSLRSKGRLCVLSFHSLEDRIVKKTFRLFNNPCICPPKIPLCKCNFTPMVKLITSKPIRPSKIEIEQNPMSRSALLRVVQKI